MMTIVSQKGVTEHENKNAGVPAGVLLCNEA